MGPTSVDDLDPFLIDPIILGPLRRHHAKPSVVVIFAVLLTAFLTTWTAALYSLLSRGPANFVPIASIKTFAIQQATEGVTAMPFFADVPSLLLSITIPLSVGTIYALFVHVSSLHSDMYKSGCLKFDLGATPGTPTDLANFNANVAALNFEFDHKSRSAIALVLSVSASLIVNLALKKTLFGFIGTADLYGSWWASLVPFRMGGVLWCLLGGLGIYAVYIESVLGLKYIKFLRKHRADFRFRANASNPDGFFGWKRLRAVITNLEFGIVLTAASAWAMSYFLFAGVGRIVGLLMLAIFVGIVFYVFISVTTRFRQHAESDKESQIRELDTTIGLLIAKTDVPSLLKLISSYERLKLVQSLPAVPMRRAWLILGLLTAGAPLVALILQLVQYITTQ